MGGSCPLVVAIAFGVGPLVERSVTVHLTVKPAGVAHPVHLGVQGRGVLRRHLPRFVAHAADHVPRRRRCWAWRRSRSARA
jgi:hypothetical protein